MEIPSCLSILLCFGESIPDHSVSLIKNKLEFFGVVRLQPISVLLSTSYPQKSFDCVFILAHASKTENNYAVAGKIFDKNLYLRFSDHVWISACNTTNIVSSSPPNYSPDNLASYSSQTVRYLILDGNILGVPGDQILSSNPVLSILYLRNFLDILAYYKCNRWWESNP